MRCEFTAAATDGESLWAYRWSCDGNPPTLYFREVDGNLLVVSEPIDDKTKGWREVPEGLRPRGPEGRETRSNASTRRWRWWQRESGRHPSSSEYCRKIPSWLKGMRRSLSR